jgi:hypothetical protein
MKNILPIMNVINIRSLRLKESNETRHFFSIYSLNSLVQLRLLSLGYMYSLNDDSFTFWKQLSYLKYLRLLRIVFLGNLFEPENSVEEKEFIIRSIFNNDYCPLLKYFSIKTCGRQRWKTAIPSLISTTKPTKIKHLSVDSFILSDFIKLLPALKNVTSFHTDHQLYFDNESNQYLQNMAIAIPLLSKCIRMHLKLSDDMMFEHVEYILKQTPNLKDLFLWGWYHLLNAKKLENLLSIQCPNLVKLELVCTGLIGEDNFDQAIDNFEQDYKTSAFWLERNITIDDEDRSGHDYRSDITIQFNIKKVTFIQMLTDFYAFLNFSQNNQSDRMEWANDIHATYFIL